MIASIGATFVIRVPSPVDVLCNPAFRAAPRTEDSPFPACIFEPTPALDHKPELRTRNHSLTFIFKGKVFVLEANGAFPSTEATLTISLFRKVGAGDCVNVKHGICLS